MKARKLRALLETTRPVHECDDKICVASAYVHDLISLDKKEFKLRYALGYPDYGYDSIRGTGELRNIWDKLQQLIDSGEIKDYIEGIDDILIENRIPVFYAKYGRILETYTDELGWPNVTVDGTLMYENSHFEDRETALAHETKSLRNHIEMCRDRLAESKVAVDKWQDKITEYTRQLVELK